MARGTIGQRHGKKSLWFVDCQGDCDDLGFGCTKGHNESDFDSGRVCCPCSVLRGEISLSRVSENVEQAIKLNPQLAKAYVTRGSLLLRQSQEKEMQAVLQNGQIQNGDLALQA